MRYIITDEKHPSFPQLYRIQATANFGNVKIGDFGGFIRSEANLSQDPTHSAWVYGDAIVTDSAKVSYHAKVMDYSIIRGNANISGFAQTRDRSIVQDDSHVNGFACTFHNTLVKDNAYVTGRLSLLGETVVHKSAHINGTATLLNFTVSAVGDYHGVIENDELTVNSQPVLHLNLPEGKLNITDRKVHITSELENLTFDLKELNKSHLKEYQQLLQAAKAIYKLYRG